MNLWSQFPDSNSTAASGSFLAGLIINESESYAFDNEFNL